MSMALFVLRRKKRRLEKYQKRVLDKAHSVAYNLIV